MALKKYIKLKGWDILDDFYEKEVKGVHLVAENFDRVFCKCGETHSSEGGIVHKCPKCGNTDFIEYSSEGYYEYPIPEKYKYYGDDTYSPYKYTIHRIKISGETDTNRETLIINVEDTVSVEFTKSEVKIFNTGTRGYRYYANKIPEDLIKKWVYFKDFEETLKEENMDVDVENLRTLCLRRENYKVAMEDPLYVQYPSLGKRVLKEVMDMEGRGKGSFKHNESFEYYLGKFGIDKSLAGVYDYYERKNKSSYRNIFSSWGNYWTDSGKIYEKLQNYKTSKCKGYEIVETYINNGMLDLEVALDLINNLNDIYSGKPTFKGANYDFYYRKTGCSNFNADFSDEVLDMIPIYIKENISLKNQRYLPYAFIEDVLTLRELKIPVTAENLKVKNMNYYLNKNRLAENYKLPADKVECFIDWFEKNPLKAIQLVENRRKLTKKQLEAFIDEISSE